jgi:hypothetical protein
MRNRFIAIDVAAAVTVYLLKAFLARAHASRQSSILTTASRCRPVARHIRPETDFADW